MLLMPSATAGLTADRADMLARRIRLLVGATISYNVVEAGVAIAAGAAASSAALLGFGLDSVIEVSSAAAVAWQFAARDHHQREARERAALRVIAVSFFALAAFVGSDAIRALAGADQARPSAAGIVLAAVSLVIMPVLSLLQRRAGRQLGSASAVADSRQTLLCTYLSGVLLLGLAANALLGWWWADPIAALVIALYAIREGRQAWRGHNCCPLPRPAATRSEGHECGCEPGCTC
jgi:divalent metal cation (Fe/Co/Zn/Cd) transporter